jgi:hypothetical protein
VSYKNSKEQIFSIEIDISNIIPFISFKKINTTLRKLHKCAYSHQPHLKERIFRYNGTCYVTNRVEELEE